MYGAQLITVVIQFLYAAVTSRTIDPDGFGSYAIALAVSGLLTLLAVGGLSQAVARMEVLELARLRSLVTYAVALGAGLGLLMWLTAPLWANLWGDSDATSIIRWLAISTSLAPLASVGQTLLRRRGKFRALATIALASNISGMALGVWAVIVFEAADALVVSPVAAQAGLLIGSLLLSGGSLIGFAKVGRKSIEVAFSAQLVPVKLADYVIGNVAKFSTSRWVGIESFGFWNRGDVVTSLPFQQIQTAIIQAISPEFRHDIRDSVRANRVWTDMLILISWVAFPLSAATAVVVPFLVPVLFGPGWEMTGVLVPWLAIASGIQILATVLASAIEVLGRLKWIWSSAVILLLIQGAAATFLFVLRDLIVAMIFLVLTQIVRHIVNVWQCGRIGYLDIRKLAKGYMFALLFGAFLAACVWAASKLIQLSFSGATPGWSILGLAILVGLSASVFALRSRFPPIRIARTYGIFSAPR